ncbi:MAG: hypothetical protein ABFS02_12675, partial [Pseudomonadota bacterium]
MSKVQPWLVNLAVGLLLSSLLSAGTAKAAEVTQIRISASSDDAEEQASGSVSLTSSDLELVHKTTDQTVGMRFAGVNVPRGAMIIDGFVQFQVDEADIGETSLKIQAEDTDDPPT